jgi:multidrug resistance protein MdtO
MRGRNKVAAQSVTLPSNSRPGAVGHSGGWLWGLLKQELSPYPGRLWVVGRVTIASTIVMLLVMTFQLPGGYLGAIFTLFLSRENPMATFRAGFRAVAAFLAATAYTAVTVTMMVADPLTHFLWVGISLLLAFYLISIMADYGTAVAFGFMIAGVIPLWDQTTLNVNLRLENTLWITYSVAIGVAVTIVVEYVFRRVHPTTDLTEGIDIRLLTVESVLRSAAVNQALDSEGEKRLLLYTTVGASRLRRLILRSEYSSQFKLEMSAAIALVGRLVDIAGSFHRALAGRGAPPDTADSKRCLRLADQIVGLSRSLLLGQPPEKINLPLEEEPSSLHFLPEMERTVSFIPKAFAGSASVQEFIPTPLDDESRERIFVADALTNLAHLKFALRGTLAAMACYVIYTSIDWPGLSTSLATCFITALSTIGSSRQKQFLRLGGALIGGIVFGMGAQIFILPFLDSIAGFTLLFAVVTAISAWISTASARLSYLGVQLALAFYLINMQEFTIQISLAIARDRVFGVLLGLVSMWLIFDRLWVKSALEEMQTAFARNLEQFAELTEQLLEHDIIKAIKRIRLLRDQINAGFQTVTAQSDAVLFEFGPERQRKLQIREDMRRWQPSVRTLLQLQTTSVQYRVKESIHEIPEALGEARSLFEEDIVRIMRAMANEVSGKPSGVVPDIQMSAARLEQEFRRYYKDLGIPLSSESSDVIELSESLASVLSPLYKDIHATFAASATAVVGQFLADSA